MLEVYSMSNTRADRVERVRFCVAVVVYSLQTNGPRWLEGVLDYSASKNNSSDEEESKKAQVVIPEASGCW